LDIHRPWQHLKKLMSWSIASDYDPEADIGPDVAPVLLYLDYLAGVREGAGDMGFTLRDFKDYVARLRSGSSPDGYTWAKEGKGGWSREALIPSTGGTERLWLASAAFLYHLRALP